MARFSDILRLTQGKNGSIDDLKELWSKTEAASDFEPLPPGIYAGRLLSKEFGISSGGHAEVTMMFEVSDGEYRGRRIFHSVYLTPAALPFARRDLAKLGITDPEDLEKPLPCIFLCRLWVFIHKSDKGKEFNRVRRFECIGCEEFPVDPFAPHGEGSDTTASEQEGPDTSSIDDMFGGSHD